MTNCELYSFLKDFLRDIYKDRHIPKHLITTMAMMMTGLFLGRHMQLWQMAVWVYQSTSCCKALCDVLNVEWRTQQ
ncbi:MAG: hypothetical protein GY847_25700 [Proteobacteria bacterium]|nr:hypothetical protein [Pseudomonadota bacterium]